MKLLLAFDTATSGGGVALLADGVDVLAQRTFPVGRAHSNRLFTEIDAALTNCGVDRGDLTGIAVTDGPGSFTGLRVGISAAKGLCAALNIPLYPVCTLEALTVRLPFVEVPVCALLDARRDEVYAALYDTSSGESVELSPPEVTTPESLLDRFGSQDVLYTGDGVATYGDWISRSATARIAPAHLRRPDPACVAWLGWRSAKASDVTDLTALEPRYLRVPSFVTRRERLQACETAA